jgi:uncharacterized membrane-anchored protein YhcB (DUF1043 family)
VVILLLAALVIVLLWIFRRQIRQRTRGIEPLELIGSVAGWVLGYLAVRLTGAEASLRAFVGTAVGLGLMVPPFYIARRKGLDVFAARCLAVGAIAGAIGGAVLVVPITVALTIAAKRKSSSRSGDSFSEFVWVCPQCTRRVPQRFDSCRCGYQRQLTADDWTSDEPSRPAIQPPKDGFTPQVVVNDQSEQKLLNEASPSFEAMRPATDGRGAKFALTSRIASVLLLLVALGASGRACQQRLARQEQERNLRLLRMAQQQSETSRLIREQMERDYCEKFLTSINAIGDLDREPAAQLLTLAACSNPESAIRQRLRQTGR